MFIRNTGFHLLSVLMFALVSGCGQSRPEEAQTGAEKQSWQTNPVAVVHWVGLKKLTAEANAAGFLKIWRLPESERLKAQTLDKLALAPWRLSVTSTAPVDTNYAALLRQNAPASLLRPLLDDLVQDECYLEIRQENKGQQGQLALAIRLEANRSAVWQTNLASVVESLTAAHRTPRGGGEMGHGWEIKVSDHSTTIAGLLRHVELARIGEWTIVGFAPGENPIFVEMLHRLNNHELPFKTSTANDWLQTVLDLRRLSAAFSWGWNPPEDWPRISVAAVGDGSNVLTHGEMKFPNPMSFQIEPWNIPRGLIHEPLHSFTAVQGLKPWLSSVTWWQNLHAGNAPNQLFFWAQSPTPVLDYAAAPDSNAANTMTKLGGAIMDDLNPVLAENRTGKWERNPNSDGILWRAPVMAPFVQSVKLTNGPFLFAGLSPLVITNSAPPSGTIKDLLSKPNVVYFDREITGARLEAWMYTSQLLRIIFRRAQLSSETKAIAWLKAIEPMLRTSETTLTRSSPDSISIERKSSVGFTSLELHILADWLESPRFPIQPNSVVAKLPSFTSKTSGTVLAPTNGKR